jgi:hypothetical protein
MASAAARTEMLSIVPTWVRPAQQAEVRFMDERRGLQRMIRALVSELRAGRGPQFRVHRRKQPVQRLSRSAPRRSARIRVILPASSDAIKTLSRCSCMGPPRKCPVLSDVSAVIRSGFGQSSG